MPFWLLFPTKDFLFQSPVTILHTSVSQDLLCALHKVSVELDKADLSPQGANKERQNMNQVYIQGRKWWVFQRAREFPGSPGMMLTMGDRKSHGCRYLSKKNSGSRVWREYAGWGLHGGGRGGHRGPTGRPCRPEQEGRLYLWQGILVAGWFWRGNTAREPWWFRRVTLQTVGRVGTAQGDWVGLLVGKLLKKKTREVL